MLCFVMLWYVMVWYVMYVCMHVCMYVRMYVWMYVCMNVCMYVPYIPCISGSYHEIIYIFLPTEIVTRMRIQLYDALSFIETSFTPI